ncbi:MAG: paraquat-inducible protein A [Oceanicaulis sp.]
MAVTDPALDPEAEAPARRAPAGGGLARALIAVAAVFLALGLYLPVMETRQLWVFKDAYSLVDTVRALYAEDERALAALVALFSIVTPVLKLSGLSILTTRRRGDARGPLAAIVAVIGRWSLADVLVVAILIVVWSSAGALGAASQPGLWFFGGSAILLLIAAELVLRDLEQLAGDTKLAAK